jgi:hypothetical protein
MTIRRSHASGGFFAAGGFFCPERLQAKACPGLDPGWRAVGARKMRRIENLMGSRSGSIQSEHDLASIRSICNFIRVKAFIIALNLREYLLR